MDLIEFSNNFQLMSKSSPWSQGNKKASSGRETYNVYEVFVFGPSRSVYSLSNSSVCTYCVIDERK